MIGPGLPNPFDAMQGGHRHASAPGEAAPLRAADATIHAALRSTPLQPPPPLLYAAVMHRVRREPRPRFHVGWLDLALSLFAAGMLIAVWWAWRSLPGWWVDYLRLLAQYQLQKLWYLNFPLPSWAAVAAALLTACLAAALLRPRRWL